MDCSARRSVVCYATLSFCPHSSDSTYRRCKGEILSIISMTYENVKCWKSLHIKPHIISVNCVLMQLVFPHMKGFYRHFHNVFVMYRRKMMMWAQGCLQKRPIVAAKMQTLLKRNCNKNTCSSMWRSDLKDFLIVIPNVLQPTASSLYTSTLWNRLFQYSDHSHNYSPSHIIWGCVLDEFDIKCMIWIWNACVDERIHRESYANLSSHVDPISSRQLKIHFITYLP